MHEMDELSEEDTYFNLQKDLIEPFGLLHDDPDLDQSDDDDDIVFPSVLELMGVSKFIYLIFIIIFIFTLTKIADSSILLSIFILHPSIRCYKCRASHRLALLI